METFVGDTITISVDAGIDLSTYDDLYIKFKRPNGTQGFWVATLDPLDNLKMYYNTNVNDLNMAGEWTIQAHASEVGVHLHGKFATFDVLEPIAETSSPPTTAPPTTPIP